MTDEIEIIDPVLRNCSQAEFEAFLYDRVSMTGREHPNVRADIGYMGTIAVEEFEDEDGRVIAIRHTETWLGGNVSYMIEESA